MGKQVLFIQGGGDDGYNADAEMVASLRANLGANFEVIYPQLPNDKNSPDFGWLKQIGKEMERLKDGAVVVAHSLGASMLIKYLSENKIQTNLSALFLLAAPFWSGNDDWLQGLKLKHDFAENLPKTIPLFFYHSHDDEEVPFGHQAKYRKHLHAATFTEIEKGGHQLGNDLSLVVKDINRLKTFD